MTRLPPWQRFTSLRLWLAPGVGVRRHGAVAVLGGVLLVIGAVLLMLWLLAGDRQLISDRSETVLVSSRWEEWGVWVAVAIVLIGTIITVTAVGRLNRSLLSHWLHRPSEAAELLFEELRRPRGPSIVALGRRTGLGMLLRGLRQHTAN